MKIYKGTPPSENPDSIYVANSLRFEEKYVALDSISGQSALKLITLNNKAYQIDSLKSHEFLASRFIIWESEAFTNKVYSFNCCHLTIPESMPNTWACKIDYNSTFSSFINKVPLKLSLYLSILFASKTNFTEEQRDNFLAGTNLNYPALVSPAVTNKVMPSDGTIAWSNENFSISASYSTSDKPIVLTISDNNPQVAFIDIKGVLI